MEPGIQELWRWFVRSAGLVLLLAGHVARAQEALQMSEASAQAAEARKKAASTLDYYNVKLGPTMWNFKADETTVFNDNINFTRSDAESDLVFRPELLARVLWPVSAVNNLTLNLGAGYSAYVRNPGLDRFFLAPGSETSFDIYSGQFWFNLHDRFSITDNAFQDANYAGTGDYQRLENTAGVGVTWDMGKLVFKAGYDHANYDAMTDNLLIRDVESELFTLSGSYGIRPSIRAGLELSLGLTSYSWLSNSSPSTTIQGDGTQWSAGPFVETRLSQNLGFRAGVGYTVFEPESKLSLGERQEGPYARLGLTHRINNYFDYILGGGRDISFNSFGGISDAYIASWQGNWHVVRKTTISTSFTYQHGTQFAYGTETYDWFGPQLLIKRPITRKLTATLGYRYFWRESTLPQNQYTADLVSLNLDYQL
jgi:hypothetical protein